MPSVMPKMENLLYSLLVSLTSLYFNGTSTPLATIATSTRSESSLSIIDQSTVINAINRFSFRFQEEALVSRLLLTLPSTSANSAKVNNNGNESNQTVNTSGNHSHNVSVGVGEDSGNAQGGAGGGGHHHYHHHHHSHNQTNHEANLIHSPLSISLGTGILLYGSNGSTTEQILHLLGLPSMSKKSEDLLHQTHAKLMKTLTAESDGTLKGRSLVRFGNLLLVSKTCTPLGSFVQHVKEDYSGLVKEVDFASPSGKQVDDVNNWVQNLTHGKIRSLIEPRNLDPNSRLILTNIVYFNGQWLKPFDAKLTREKTFYNYDKSESEVQMMYVSDSFRFKEFTEEGLTMVELPYKGNLSMILTVPLEKSNITSALKVVSHSFNQLYSQLEKEEIVLRMPKIKVEQDIDLKPTFKKLGLKAAFGQDADFSKISGKESLYVSSASQRVLIDINEQGTEAVAITSYKMYARSMFFGPEVIVNKPFAFIIRDDRSGVFLFQGVIQKL